MDNESIKALAEKNGLEVLLWEPLLLKHVNQTSGQTIRIDPDGDVAAQIEAGLPKLKEWMAATPPQVPKAEGMTPAPCGGCQANALKNAISTFKTGIGLAKFVGEMVVGIKATQEQHDQRKATCEGCPLLDSLGERLYREHGEHHSCGKPRLENIVRDEAKDGCGCWLEMKWWGKSEKCPLGKW